MSEGPPGQQQTQPVVHFWVIWHKRCYVLCCLMYLDVSQKITVCLSLMYSEYKWAGLQNHFFFKLYVFGFSFSPVWRLVTHSVTCCDLFYKLVKTINTEKNSIYIFIGINLVHLLWKCEGLVCKVIMRMIKRLSLKVTTVHRTHSAGLDTSRPLTQNLLIIPTWPLPGAWPPSVHTAQLCLRLLLHCGPSFHFSQLKKQEKLGLLVSKLDPWSWELH